MRDESSRRACWVIKSHTTALTASGGVTADEKDLLPSAGAAGSREEKGMRIGCTVVRGRAGIGTCSVGEWWVWWIKRSGLLGGASETQDERDSQNLLNESKTLVSGWPMSPEFGAAMGQVMSTNTSVYSR